MLEKTGIRICDSYSFHSFWCLYVKMHIYKIKGSIHAYECMCIHRKPTLSAIYENAQPKAVWRPLAKTNESMASGRGLRSWLRAVSATIMPEWLHTIDAHAASTMAHSIQNDNTLNKVNSPQMSTTMRRLK